MSSGEPASRARGDRPAISVADVHRAFERRDFATRQLAAAADELIAVARELAGRFRDGATLFVIGNGADAGHIAVEFMHPVIVGKPALPAVAPGNDAMTMNGVGTRSGFTEAFAYQVRHLARPGDVVVGITPDGRCANVRRALEAARDMGLSTIALSGGDPSDAPVADRSVVVGADDPLLVKELHVTVYHLLWELVHVFLDGPPQEAGPLRERPGEAVVPDGPGQSCLTCADAATPARVVQLLPHALALAESDGATTEISVALVDAEVGSTVLVHAGEAIAVVGGEDGVRSA